MAPETLTRDEEYRDSQPMTVRELAVGIGTTVALFMTVVLVPVTGIFASVFTPLPSTVSLYRWGRSAGIWVPGGAAVLGGAVLMAMGAHQSLAYYLELLTLGTLLGLGMRRPWSLSRMVGDAAVKVFLLGTALFWLTHAGAEGGVFAHLERRLMALMEALMQGSGLSQAQEALVRENLARIVPFVVKIFPGMALGSTIVFAWINLYLATRLLRRQRVALPPWPQWRRWSAPEVLVWGVIAAGFLTLVPSTGARILGLNLLFALGAVYLLHGVAILAFYMAKWNVPGLLRGVIYGVVFLQQFVSLGVVMLGLFDTWFDFRRLKPKADPTPVG
ncbi:Uncharacterized conserved protein YybS, DUF2232 family [Desulfacinum hydrothermale DSM 13146]|uniref:Uncharacterized conserved protein YybS, DUF2232 family n=1 Tax=Desulfacinum hydrothermale DSM 13146 TaxID=1121390 RepID=A0A1W1XRD9_9BACT|nr:YybS family protein [Desulfacinum hydrothermale]SMC26550.1 Uncharacterized conserved protein YybS, DUF2232 family [Desulfacinum hydrothermale DSM 13146]